MANAKECIYLPSRRRGNPKPRPELQVDNTNAVDSVVDNDGMNRSECSPLLDLYYEFFHTAHPCVLPRAHLDVFLARDELCPLVRVLCYIGSLFSASVSSEDHSREVQNTLTAVRARVRPVTGFDVQAVLLYSIALYWSNEPEYGTMLLDEAIEMAVGLGMNRREFATSQGEDNPVLEESWRRTWWLFYTTDAHIAGSTHVFPFRTSRIHQTVDLPCEEHEYETGVIMHISLPQ